VAKQCVTAYLGELPPNTRLVVMFGLGTKLNYVRDLFKLFETSIAGNWQWINEVAYTDGKTTFVHVEHFASQGALIPNWLGEKEHERSRLGQMAKSAVSSAFATAD